MKGARAAATLGWMLVVGCGPGSPPPAPVVTAPLVPEARQQVESWDHLRVQRGDEVAELTRSAEGWRLMTPGHDVPADEPRVRSLLRALGAPLTVKREHPTEAERTRWGLQTPRSRVEVSGADRRLALALGEEDPFDGSVALSRAGTDAVYALPGGAAQDLEQTPYGLREKRVVRWPAEAIVRIEVSLPGEHFVLVREGPKGWRLGDGRLAEATDVNRALHADLALRFLRFSEVAGRGPTAKDPSITWQHRDGRRVTLALTGEDAQRTEGSEKTWGQLPFDAAHAWRTGAAALVKRPP